MFRPRGEKKGRMSEKAEWAKKTQKLIRNKSAGTKNLVNSYLKFMSP